MIDVGPLYGSSPRAVDDAVGRAFREDGFVVITGHRVRGDARNLLRFFDLPLQHKMALARHQNNPANQRIYRGWFPALAGERSFKEGIDIGPERTPDAAFLAREVLFEPNLWPPEALLPGWRDAVLAYQRAISALSFLILRSVARYLALPETYFDARFEDANASLRLLKYPLRKEPADLEGLTWVDDERHIVAYPHTDSGCLTLLAQDNVGGLQAQNRAGDWVDVPPAEGSLVVQIGDTLARWTNDVFRATCHRVVGPPVERYSIPFFFEPRFDTVIECLPSCIGADGPKYPPVRFGDHLLQKMSGYTEFHTLFRDGKLQRPTI